ncbi:S41 family peptidase [Flavobacterium sp. CFBP9031]|jgi:C-terminal processing protease CtpA/Prc|uniref:S41 family peptidase n=1 Tax=Flavobacterium sp. CFBP9031 TaxID=3096538 RepID=UPI002A6A952A|nr:S41 family peptidase [Flavobacterium sp. CFBP9031]MDY0986625.1 S41 family peptidase [Flavobacterium sp. CFBP9031]
MMKKILFIACVFFFQFGYSQDKVSEVEKLALTAKVWGFLKYYHPNVADGSKNWDKELLQMLPQIEKVQTANQFSKIIEDLVDSLGTVREENIIFLKDVAYFDKNFDLSWISENKIFSNDLSRKLKFIEKNRYQGKPFYVGQTEAGNVFLMNEDISGFNWQKQDLRLLALFRYWNVIEYFYPYKYLMDNNWSKTLEQMLPNFLNFKNEDDFKIAMLKLVVRINDTHSSFYFTLSKNSGKIRKFLPMKCIILDKKMVVTEILSDTLAKHYDIKIGDVITKVDNKTISQIMENERDYISASNESAYLRNLVSEISSSYNDFMDLEISRNKIITNKRIECSDYNLSHSNEFKKSKSEKYYLLEDNIGYVNMSKLKISDVADMFAKFRGTQAIILDSRNYPKGANFEISNFLNSTSKAFAKYTIPDLSYPGKFYWQKELHFCGAQNKDNYKGKVIVLVNENSVSQSEWATMCFQTADDATVIGSQTSGADGNTSHIDFVKDYDAPFSGIGVYYPDGRETQRIGIVPDIKVERTVLGIQNGKDEILDRAILFIKDKK